MLALLFPGQMLFFDLDHSNIRWSCADHSTVVTPDKKGSKPKEEREREMLDGLLRDMHRVWQSLGVIQPNP